MSPTTYKTYPKPAGSKNKLPLLGAGFLDAEAAMLVLHIQFKLVKMTVKSDAVLFPARKKTLNFTTIINTVFTAFLVVFLKKPNKAQ